MIAANEFLPLNPRDYLILFALADGERHGYGIVKDVESESAGTVRMDPSNLYRTLRRFIHQGLVTESEPRGSGESDERRRYYALTLLGRRVVEAEAARLATLAEAARARRLIPGKRA